MFVAVRDLIDGVPLPALIDLRKWWEGEAKGWETFVSNVLSLFSAVAYLVDPKSPPRLFGFPEAVDQLLIPFEVFTDEAEAMAFLRGFLPSE